MKQKSHHRVLLFYKNCALKVKLRFIYSRIGVYKQTRETEAKNLVKPEEEREEAREYDDRITILTLF